MARAAAGVPSTSADVMAIREMKTCSHQLQERSVRWAVRGIENIMVATMIEMPTMHLAPNINVSPSVNQ